MDFFSQNEASQLVKTALNAGAIKLNGIRSNAAECEAAAKIDAAYMLELYRTLLGPDGAAASATQGQQAQQPSPQAQPPQQGQPSQQGQQQQHQNEQRQQQQGRQPNQQQGQPQGPSQSQGHPQAQQYVQAGQPQQPAPVAQSVGAGAPAMAAAGPDFQSYIPEAYRGAAAQGGAAQPGAPAAVASVGAGAPGMGTQDFQNFIPESFRDAAGSAASQGMSQPAMQQQAAMAQANAGGMQASQPGAPGAGGMPGGVPGGQPDFRKFIPEAYRASVPETPSGQ